MFVPSEPSRGTRVGLLLACAEFVIFQGLWLRGLVRVRRNKPVDTEMLVLYV